jgi:uncharacterized protein (DUF58 family)
MKPVHYLHDLFLTKRFFLCWTALGLLFVFSYFSPVLLLISKAFLALVVLLVLIDYTLLFLNKGKIQGLRQVNEVFSNGDQNQVTLRLRSTYNIGLKLRLIDELPIQFQDRNFELNTKVKPSEKLKLSYSLRPLQRGEYHFGELLLYASNGIGFLERRFVSMKDDVVRVYPSFQMLKKFQIHTLPNANAQSGSRVLYRKGMSTEFDHIKEYNRGDDIRTINWRASARRNQLMVNSFMDEKSQQIYCLLDKGRLMKMPFNGLSLLDYAINASLMFSYVALQKDDKVGMITFSEKMNDVLQPSKSKKQFNAILETLYKQETAFLESNYESLYAKIAKGIGQRSLLLLFTNFESYSGFERKFAYLKAINKRHLLCVVLFENSEITRIHDLRGNSVEDIYIKTIADQFAHEKKMIVKELTKAGIMAIHSTPEKLTISVVNRYLELKANQVI